VQAGRLITRAVWTAPLRVLYVLFVSHETSIFKQKTGRWIMSRIVTVTVTVTVIILCTYLAQIHRLGELQRSLIKKEVV
jgi:hypothetical protein